MSVRPQYPLAQEPDWPWEAPLRLLRRISFRGWAWLLSIAFCAAVWTAVVMVGRAL